MSNPCPHRRLLVAAAALAPLAVHLPAAVAQPAQFQMVRPPQTVDSGAKIEVLEFFQYSCPHCFTLSTPLAAWAKRKGSEIDLRRISVHWDNSTINHTRIYYTLETMGLVDKLHEKVFVAIHRERKRLLDPNEIADFMAAQGVDRAAWLTNFNSFAVNTRTARANQVWRAYKVDGTPVVAVDGKFMTGPSMAGSLDATFTVLDSLVARARQERGK